MAKFTDQELEERISLLKGHYEVSGLEKPGVKVRPYEDKSGNPVVLFEVSDGNELSMRQVGFVANLIGLNDEQVVFELLSNYYMVGKKDGQTFYFCNLMNFNGTNAKLLSLTPSQLEVETNGQITTINWPTFRFYKLKILM